MNQSTLTEQVVQNAIFVVASPRIPAAARSLGGPKREQDRASYEEEKLAIFTAEFLKPLTAIKSRLRRALMGKGSSIDTMGAWVIPLTVWPGVKVELENCRTEWEAQVTQLCAMLPGQVSALCAAYPSDAELIKKHAVSPSDFEQSARFVFMAFSLSDGSIQEQASLDQELLALPTKVLEDLHKMVQDGRRDGASAGSSYAPSTKEFIQSLVEKCSSFSFLHTSMGTLAQQMASVAAALPVAQMVTGAKATLVRALFAQLATPKRLLEHGLSLAKEYSDIASEAAVALSERAAASKEPKVKVQSAQAVKAGSAKAARPALANMPASVVHYNPVCI